MKVLILLSCCFLCITPVACISQEEPTICVDSEVWNYLDPKNTGEICQICPLADNEVDHLPMPGYITEVQFLNYIPLKSVTNVYSRKISKTSQNHIKPVKDTLLSSTINPESSWVVGIFSFLIAFLGAFCGATYKWRWNNHYTIWWILFVIILIIEVVAGLIFTAVYLLTFEAMAGYVTFNVAIPLVLFAVARLLRFKRNNIAA